MMKKSALLALVLLPLCAYAQVNVQGTSIQIGGNVSSGGGGVTSITSPNNTITVGGTSAAPTLDLNLGHANTWTVPITVTGAPGMTLAAGTAAAGAAGKVVYGTDATVGYAEVNENNTGLSRICTAANGVCTSGGGGTATSYLGMFSANSNQTSAGSNDGISKTLARGDFGTGTVLVDPNYTTADQSAMDNAAGPRTGFLDMRQGGFHLRSLSPGPTGTNGGSSVGGNSNFGIDCRNGTSLGDTTGAYSAPGSNTCMYTRYESTVPGYSYGAIYPALPSGWYGTAIWDVDAFNYSASINKSLIQAQVRDYGKGDTSTVGVNLVNDYGGGDESAGEGNHDFRWFSTKGQENFTGTLSTAGTDNSARGYVQLTVSQSNPTLGVMRHLLNSSTVQSDTITTTANNANGTMTLTTTGTTYPVSTVVSIGQDINPPASSEQAKTSTTFTVNTTADLTSLVGQQMQMSDPLSTECAVIKAAGTYNSTAHTQTLTAMLGEHHSNGSSLYIGGMSCHFLTPTSIVMARTNNINVDYYVLGSTANNQLVVGAVGQASWLGVPYVPGAVKIYSGARVLDIRGGTPGDADNTVKVEETNATWASGNTLLSGMVASAENSTFYYNLTDNNPNSTGQTNWYYLNGAQAGGLNARDFTYVQNQMAEADYTPGGGPFSLAGSWFHWKGPIGNVFTIDNSLHGHFLQNYGCNYLLVDGQSSITPTCAAGGDTAGWELDGHTIITQGSSNKSAKIADFSWLNGINFLTPTVIQNTSKGDSVTPSLLVKAPSPGTGNSAEIDGTTFLNGNTNVSGTLSMNGSNKIVTNALNMPAVTNCVVGTNNVGDFMCNPNAITANYYVSTTTGGTSYGINQSGTPIGGMNNNLGAIQIHAASGAGGQAGILQLAADQFISAQSPFWAGNGSSNVTGTYNFRATASTGQNVAVFETLDQNSYATIRMAAPGTPSTTEAIWQFGVNATNTGGGNFYFYDQTNGKTAMTIVRGSENLVMNGDVSPLSDTLAAGTSCGTHAANALWADDNYVYHCNAAGTAAKRAALTAF